MSYIPNPPASNGPTRTYSATHTPQRGFTPQRTGSRKNHAGAHKGSPEANAGASLQSQVVSIVSAPLSYGLLQRTLRRGLTDEDGSPHPAAAPTGTQPSTLGAPQTGPSAAGAASGAQALPHQRIMGELGPGPQPRPMGSGTTGPRNPGMKGPVLSNVPRESTGPGRQPFQPDLTPTAHEGGTRRPSGLDPRKRGTWLKNNDSQGNLGGLFG